MYNCYYKCFKNYDMNKLTLVLCALIISSISIMAQKDEKNEDNKDKKKEKHEKDVQLNEIKLIGFYKKALVDSIAEMYSNNCYFAHDFMTRLESKEEVKNKLKGDFKKGFKVLEMKYTVDDLKTYGDIILETGILSIKYIAPLTATTVIKKYNYNLVWKESSDKKYRIRSEIWSPVENPCK
jgi:hypothetical protein